MKRNSKLLILILFYNYFKFYLSYNNIIYLYNQGKYFQYTLNNENKAIYYYNQIIQLIEEKEEKEDNQDNIKEFDYSGMYNDLGILKERRNDYIGAEIAYKKAIYYSPNFLSALCNLAHIKILKGEIVEAKKLYLKAINSSNVTPEILYNYALFL